MPCAHFCDSFLFVGGWVDFKMENKDKESPQDKSEENGREAYNTIQKWIKTIPSTIADIKANLTKECFLTKN